MPRSTGFTGHAHTKKAKECIRLAHLGKPKSPEHRARISAAHKGKRKNYPVWNKGRRMPETERAALSEKMRGKDCLTPEQRLRQKEASSRAHKGIKWSKIRRSRLRRTVREHPRMLERRNEKIRAAHRKLWEDPIYANRRSKQLSAANLGKTVSATCRRKLSTAVRNLWKDETYAKAMWRAFHRKPTSPEKRVDQILHSTFPGEWRYVGNGKFVVGGKIPDFVNINGHKAVIEVFGRYWHKRTDAATRTRHFKRYGFKTLCVWEDISEQDFMRKVRDFV